MTKARCKGTNVAGEPCRAYGGAHGYCFMHDAAKGSERAAARRNGGRATKKPHGADASLLPPAIRTMDGVFALLNYTLKESIVLDNSIQRGRLLISIAHGYIEALKVGELENRLEALENALKLKR